MSVPDIIEVQGETPNLPARIDETTGEIIPAAASEAGLPATYGIAETALSAEENAALLAPVDPEHDIEIKPDGIVFMPGVVLRERLCRAIGPGQWALRQEAPPIWHESEGMAIYDGSLWIRGRFVSRALGQCEWRPANRHMSRLDALEGAKTDCLRRCCKDLGIGSELWHRDVCEAWKAQHAEKYWDERKDKYLWRKKSRAGTFDEGDSLGDDQPGADTKPSKAPSAPVGDAPACPKCGKPMKLRNGKKGHFWGCSGYPECRGTMNRAEHVTAEAKAAAPPPDKDAYLDVLTRAAAAVGISTKEASDAVLRHVDGLAINQADPEARRAAMMACVQRMLADNQPF